MRDSFCLHVIGTTDGIIIGERDNVFVNRGGTYFFILMDFALPFLQAAALLSAGLR